MDRRMKNKETPRRIEHTKRKTLVLCGISRFHEGGVAKVRDEGIQEQDHLGEDENVGQWEGMRAFYAHAHNESDITLEKSRVMCVEG